VTITADTIPSKSKENTIGYNSWVPPTKKEGRDSMYLSPP
jgi:hypothetical protein